MLELRSTGRRYYGDMKVKVIQLVRWHLREKLRNLEKTDKKTVSENVTHECSYAVIENFKSVY